MLVPWRPPWDMVLSGQLVTLSFKYTSGCKKSILFQLHFWQSISYKKHLHLYIVMKSFEAIDSITSRYSTSLVLPTCVVDGSSQALQQPEFALSSGTVLSFLWFWIPVPSLKTPAAHPKGRIKAEAHNLNAILCQPSWISQLFFTR